MAKKSTEAAAADTTPEPGSDRATLALVDQIIELLADCSPDVRRRVLETVGAFYPSRLKGEPSGNGLGYMP